MMVLVFYVFHQTLKVLNQQQLHTLKDHGLTGLTIMAQVHLLLIMDGEHIILEQPQLEQVLAVLMTGHGTCIARLHLQIIMVIRSQI